MAAKQKSLVSNIAVYSGWLGLAFALVWLALSIIPGRAAGVTGNDPSTYVQMAHDIVAHGTLLHRFDGMAQVEAAGLHPALLAPAGYLPRKPADLTLAAPLYPAGWPLLLALSYKLGGDAALWWTLPVVALLTAVLVWWVSRSFLAEIVAPPMANAGAVWALALLLTVKEQMAFALSPMSDLPAQMAGLLALACALQARRRDLLRWATLCGLALGYGYLVRHAMFLMLIPVGWLLWQSFTGQRRRLVLALVVLGASVFILPDLVYHKTVLGGWLEPESPDSLTFRFNLIAPTLDALVRSPESFGWPFYLVWAGAAVGLALRRWRGVGLLAIGWVVAFVGFHAGLKFTGNFGNVVRYNLPALPGVALLATLPLVAGADWLSRQERPRLHSLALAGLGLVGPVVMLLRTPDFHFTAYGFLDEEGRTAYEALADELPANAVILTNDQHAGAIAMYSGLAVARPQYWPRDEFELFLETMHAEGRPVLTPGTPAYPLDFLWDYGVEPTGIQLERPPDGGDGVVHRVP